MRALHPLTLRYIDRLLLTAWRSKTGVTVPDSGVRDEHGMEPIENIFSSPGKPDDRDDSQDDGLSDEEGSGEAAMDITTSRRPRPVVCACAQGAAESLWSLTLGCSIRNWAGSAAQRSWE